MKKIKSPSSVMFRNCYLSLSCLCAFLIIPAQCSGTFFKLVGSDGDALKMGGRLPFLTQAFFSCGLNEDCEEVSKIQEISEFSSVIGQHAKKEEVIVYRKDDTQKIKGKLDFEFLYWFKSESI